MIYGDVNMNFRFINLQNRQLIKVIAVILLIGITLVVFCVKKSEENEGWISVSKEASEEAEGSGSAETTASAEQDVQIIVDIAGQVEKPSVYILPAGSRVYEGIEAAGGLTEKADTRFLNLAASLADGTKLYIPSEEEAKETENAVPEKEKSSGGSSFYMDMGVSAGDSLINLNTADSSELQKLPRIGPATAEKIIAYRKEFGKFKQKEELMNVSGIGEKTFESLKNLITVE